jgi:hypothetical protein
VKFKRSNADEDGFSWLASYQYAPVGLFKFEADLDAIRVGLDTHDRQGLQRVNGVEHLPAAHLVLQVSGVSQWFWIESGRFHSFDAFGRRKKLGKPLA